MRMYFGALTIKEKFWLEAEREDFKHNLRETPRDRAPSDPRATQADERHSGEPLLSLRIGLLFGFCLDD